MSRDFVSLHDLRLRWKSLLAILQRERQHAADPEWLERRIALRLEMERIEVLFGQEQDRLEQQQIAEIARQREQGRQKRLRAQQRKEASQIRAQLKQAQREWDESEHVQGEGEVPKPTRIWMHPTTEPAEVIPPVPITEAELRRDLAPHLSATEIENRARAMVFHNYATLGRRRSRRYEGFR
jgi:hypothetical protein